MDELRLNRAPAKQRRTDVQHKRGRGRQANACAERATIASWCALEPLIEALCTGHNDSVGRDIMELDRFGVLRRVPDSDDVRHPPNERLARQIVPAPDAEQRSETQRLRAAQILE